MRNVYVFVGSVTFGASTLGCHRAPAPNDTVRVDAAVASTIAPSASSAPAAAASTHITRRAVFTLSEITLTIEDIRMSSRLDDVQRRASADLVVNGGFFDPDGAPVGLAISNGAQLSAFRPKLSGGVLWIRDGVAHLTATEDYREESVDFALQCRPRLVVGSHVNIRSDDGRRAERTAVCLRESGKTIEFVAATGERGVADPTLRELAEELAAGGCEEALNFDGGPSTGWAAPSDGGVTFVSPIAPVRHAVVVTRRAP
jgi:uncharacterized protein YigE (DUF2233 family)